METVTMSDLSTHAIPDTLDRDALRSLTIEQMVFLFQAGGATVEIDCDEETSITTLRFAYGSPESVPAGVPRSSINGLSYCYNYPDGIVEFTEDDKLLDFHAPGIAGLSSYQMFLVRAHDKLKG